MTKTIALLILAAMPMTGCQTSLPGAIPSQDTGVVSLNAPLFDGRQIQYVAGDINAVKVSILDADNGNAVVTSNVYSGTSLANHLSGGKINFEIDNLKVNDGTHPTYHYLAKVETYLDSAASSLIGSSVTAGSFTVSTAGMTSVTLPALTLIATPVGNAAASGSNAVTVVDNPAPAVIWR